MKLHIVDGDMITDPDIRTIYVILSLTGVGAKADEMYLMEVRDYPGAIATDKSQTYWKYQNKKLDKLLAKFEEKLNG
ncbi:MAG: hypothetical protein JKY52_07215 [Flavobacteriales bacterium]|nr:hypothetical protein [Flavobacteriales bacterium]